MAGTSKDFIDQHYAEKAAEARRADPLQNNLFTPQTPVGTPAQAPAPIPYGDNPILNALAGIGNAALDTGQKTWNTLQIPQALVRAGVGLGNQEVGQERIHQVARMNPMPGLSSLPEGVKDLAGDIVTDPLTFVGLGIPGKALATATNPNVIRVLRTLERADAETQATLSALFQTLPAAGAKAGLSAIPIPTREIKDVVKPGQTIGSFQPGDVYTRNVSNLWDAFTATSARSHFKSYLRDLVDSIKILNGKGWDLDKVMVDQDRFTELVQYPGSDKALANLRAAQLDLNREVRNAANPLLRIGGLELIKQREVEVYKAFAQANLRIVDAQQSGMAGRQLADLTETSLRQAYEEASRVTESARQVFGELIPRVEQIPPMPATLINDIQRETGRGLNRYAQSYQWMGQRAGQGTPGQPLADLSTLRGGMHATLTGVDPALNASRTLLTSGLPREEARALIDPGEIGSLIRQRIDQMEHGELGIPSFMADLPPDLQSRMGTGLGSFLKYGGEVRNERQRVVQAVQDAWKLRMGTTPIPAFTPGKPYEWVTDTFHQMGILEPNQTISSITQIPDRLMNILPPHQVAAIKGSANETFRTGISKFPAGDIFTTDAFDLVVDRVGRQYAKNLGLSDEGSISGMIQQATNLFKEQALATPTYLLTNMIGGLFMGALKGQNPMPILRDIQTNVAKAWNGQPVTTKALENLTVKYGIKASPQSLTGGTGYLTEINIVRDYLKKGLTASQAVGSRTLGVAGGLAGGLSGAMSSPQDATPEERAKSIATGVVAGTAGGATLPVVSKYLLQRLGQGLETVMRENAYATGFVRAIDTDKLYQIADDAMAIPVRTVNPGAGQTATIQNIPVQSQQVRQVLQAEQGQVAPQDLEKLLVKAGVSGSVARQAGKDWESVVQEASRAGQQFAHSIHFDYENLNNFEEFSRKWFLFSTWALKAFPFFAEQVAKNPAILVTIREIQEKSDREREQSGNTARFSGSLPMDGASQVWSAILGRPIEAWYNPLRMLVPFSDTARTLDAGSRDEPPLATALRGISAFGPGLHPFAESALRLSGKLGDEPASGYLRLGGAVQGATGALTGVNRGTGVDLNKIFTAPETAIRQTVAAKLPGNSPEVTDLTTTAILKRLDELAIERTGQTTQSGDANVGPFIAAKSARQGPIWDEAARQVAQERGVRATSGVLFQGVTPQAVQSKTEGQIREARTERLITDELTGKIKDAVEKDPNQILGEDIVGPIRGVAIELSKARPDGQLSAAAQQFFSTPSAWTARNVEAARKELAQYQMQQNPIIQGYSGQGSPLYQDLSNQLASYYNLPSLLGADPAYAGMPPQDMQALAEFSKVASHPLVSSVNKGGGADDLVLGQLRKVQENYRGTHPMLDAYLKWQLAQRNTGTIEQFVEIYPRMK